MMSESILFFNLVLYTSSCKEKPQWNNVRSLFIFLYSLSVIEFKLLDRFAVVLRGSNHIVAVAEQV